MFNLKRVATTLSFLIIFLVFVSCNQQKQSEIRNEVVKFDSISDLIEKIKNDKLLTKEEIDMFTTGLARTGGIEDSIKGKTVGNIIDNEKEFLRNSSISGLTTTSLNLLHSFGFISIKPIDQDGGKFTEITYAIQNRSKSDIKRIEGRLNFVNAASQPYRMFPIKIDQEIKAGSTSQFRSSFIYEENNPYEKALREAIDNNTQNVFSSWQPITIELANGKILTLEKPKK